MDMINIVLGIGHVSVGFLIVMISIPLVQRRISMNKLYGIRFKKSYTSEVNWYKINASGGKQLITWATPLILFGAVTFFLT